MAHLALGTHWERWTRSQYYQTALNGWWVCSRATGGIVRIAVWRARRNDAIARPADGAIVGPQSHHRRCVDALG